MVAGRPRKPDLVKIADGTYRKDRDGNPEEKPNPTGFPVKPSNLVGLAGEHWDYNVPRLIEIGIAKDTDQNALEAMCHYWQQFKRGKKITQRNEAFKEWIKIARSFGMTPADRGKLNVKPAAGGVRRRQA